MRTLMARVAVAMATGVTPVSSPVLVVEICRVMLMEPATPTLEPAPVNLNLTR